MHENTFGTRIYVGELKRSPRPLAAFKWEGRGAKNTFATGRPTPSRRHWCQQNKNSCTKKAQMQIMITYTEVINPIVLAGRKTQLIRVNSWFVWLILRPCWHEYDYRMSSQI